MNWLDIVLLIILAGSVASSLRKGLTREVIGLISVIVALLVGLWFYGIAGWYLLPYVSSRAIANFAGFLLVFVTVLLFGAAVGALVGRMLKFTGLSFVDHLMGAGFGLLRGIVISVALVVSIMAFSPGGKPPVAVVGSRVAPYMVDAARVCAALAPRELKLGFRQTYEQVKIAWANAWKGKSENSERGKRQKDEREL
jgi:membrane protein required for colicin V production